MKYEIAHLIGSTENNEERFRNAEITLTKMGYICFRPVIYNLSTYLRCKELIDDMCKEKLLLCDICVIVTPEKIGESTKQMIQLAINLGKTVYEFSCGVLQLFQVERLDIEPINPKPVEIDSVKDATNFVKSHAEKEDERPVTFTLNKSRTARAHQRGKFIASLDAATIIKDKERKAESDE